MLNRLLAIALLPLLAVAAFLVAYFVFYSGGYDAPPSPAVSFDHIGSTPIPPRVSEDPLSGQLRQGLLVIDAQHVNAFMENELVNFASKVADRGFEVEFAGDSTPLMDPSQGSLRLRQLAEKLRRADAFVVILPQAAYTEQEAVLVERFVEKGGKLMLVSDPSRPHRINALAKRFGVDFQPDYLYNTVENDANFKRILIREFQPDQITAGLETITLDYAGSVQSPSGGLAFTTPSTRSSLLSTVGTLAPMAWGNSRNVLAIADFTFMVPNNDSLLDNGRLVSNIADYLTDSGREFHLSDFPYFYGSGHDGGVDILMGRPALLNTSLQVKSALAGRQLSTQVVPAEDLGRDTVFLGLYQDAPQVAQYLQIAGVRVDDTLGTAFASELPLENTSLMVLDQSQGRDMLIVLADTPANLNGAVSRLISGEFRGDLVSDFVALSKFDKTGS